MTDTKQFLSDIVVYSKYAKYVPESKRRETWEELVFRNAEMHARKYPQIADEIYDVYTRSVLPKRVVPSMRSFQFAGKAIEVNHSRMFNCASRKLDSAIAFAEVMFLLLGGSGVGISVQKHHISKIPALNTPKNRSKKFVVSDDIQGWADAIKVLMKSYTGGKTSYHFDFSEIRPKGTRLVTAGGKAPGPEPLKKCINHIKKILDRAIEDRGEGCKLKPIEAHDIACHIANAVLAGGIRRSAMISLFSEDDEEMLLCKGNFPIDVVEVVPVYHNNEESGFNVQIKYQGRLQTITMSLWELNQIRETGTLPWYKLEEQRGRANNSVMLLRDKTTENEFVELMKKVENSKAGEPGVYWTNDLELGTNPCCEISLDLKGGFCVDGDTRLITRYGINNIRNLVGTNVEIWNGERWSEVLPVKTGENQDMYRVEFSDGSYLDATSYHKFLIKNRFQTEYEEVETIDLIDKLADSKYGLHVPRANIIYTDGDDHDYSYDYGFVLGDGSIDYNTNGSVKNIRAGLFGEKLNLPLNGNLNETVEINSNGIEYRRMSFGDILDKNFVKLLKCGKGLPNEIFAWSKHSILEFVAGWADADGTNASKGIRIYGDEFKIRDAQLLLTKCGINSSVNLMDIEGSYTNLGERKSDVWYLQITKTVDIPCHRLKCDNDEEAKFKGKYQIIKSVTKLDGLYDSYCFEEHELHQGVFNNVLTKQCNLTEVNVSELESEEDLIQRVKDATFIGTLQAGYTDFHYLGTQWKDIAEEDALLGVSMTGIGSGQVLQYDIKRAAEEAVTENKRVASLIGINPAKRIGTIKPSGCRPKDGLVTTTKGIYTLEELIPSTTGEQWDDVVVEAKAIQDRGYNSLTKTYRNGVDEVFAIDMMGGIRQESTANHKWYVLNKGFVKTEDLQKNDVIDISIGVYNITEHKELLSNEYVPNINDHSSTNITQPRYMNEDLAWLIGYLWGDGTMSIYKHRFRFIDENLYNLEKVVRIFKEQFGLDADIKSASGSRNASVVEVGSIQLWSWFIVNGIYKYSEDGINNIPLCVRESSFVDIIAFIAGFADADGCVYKQSDKYKCLTISQSYSSGITRHIQNVALSVGLHLTHSFNTKGWNMQKDKNMVLMYLTSKSKQYAVEVLMRNMNKCVEMFPELPLSSDGLGLKNTFTLGKVKSVESIGYTETFDIEVENDHWFYAGAVKSHNTASLVLGSASGIHAWHNDYYERRMRINKDEAIYNYLNEKLGSEFLEDDCFNPDRTSVLRIPVKAPEGSILRTETPIDLLERVKKFQIEWIRGSHIDGANTHNVSVTVSIKPDEWETVTQWMWENKDFYNGISVLDYDGGTYPQMPFTDCTKEEYERLESILNEKLKNFDITDVLEEDDNTDLKGEAACSGNACEVSSL